MKPTDEMKELVAQIELNHKRSFELLMKGLEKRMKTLEKDLEHTKEILRDNRIVGL